MPTKQIADLRGRSNIDILNAIRGEASTDYRNRVPDATRANISDTISAMWDYRPTRNEFIESLVNRIGLVLARSYGWTNPLAEFKIGLMNYGDSIEEYSTGLLNAYTYDATRDYGEKMLFGIDDVEVQTSFHRINRQNVYKLSVNQTLLKRAFLSDTGLSAFIADLMDMPTKSANWDEFLLMADLFRQNYDNGGFFKVQSPNVSAPESGESDAKTLLRQIRSYAGRIPFISRDYNAANMPVAAKREDLMLFLTPEADAALDVEALAAVFNLDKAEVQHRKVIIPEENFNIPGAQAILTTKDFFVVADTVLEIQSQPNAAALYENFFYHVHQIISMSRFVPAILFTTEAGTVIPNNPNVPVSMSEITMTDADGETVTAATRGEWTQLGAEVTTDPADGDNDAIIWSVQGQESARTRVFSDGVLLVGLDDPAESLTVTATAAEAAEVTATLEVPVTGDRVQAWPRTGETIVEEPEDPVEPTP